VASSRSSSAILGKIAWLMMESPWHRDRRVEDFARLVMPAIKLRQFRLFEDGERPIAFVSWARISSAVEPRFIDNPFSIMPEEWASGPQAYLVDFAVASGRLRQIARLLRQDVEVRSAPVRGLKLRNGRRICVEITAEHISATPIDP
jgi:cytolysin-activating lysine-acyltransferase